MALFDRTPCELRTWTIEGLELGNHETILYSLDNREPWRVPE